MTETSLRRYLRISGWATIIASFVSFGVNIIEKSQRLSKFDAGSELRAETFAIYTFGFGIELPLTLTVACLCLMAARYLTFKQQTLQSVFE